MDYLQRGASDASFVGSTPTSTAPWLAIQAASTQKASGEFAQQSGQNGGQ